MNQAVSVRVCVALGIWSLDVIANMRLVLTTSEGTSNSQAYNPWVR